MKHLVVACLMGLLSAPIFGQAWSQWRGPQRDGHAPAWQTGLDKPDKLWQVPSGEGHSSPVTENGHVFIISRESDQEVVRGIRVDNGKTVWEHRYDAPFKMHSAATSHGKGPKATSAVSHGTLITFGITGIISAFKATDGTLLWQKRHFEDPIDDFTVDQFCGASSSPMVLNELIVVHSGNGRRGALVAYKMNTGEVAWERKGSGPAYCSPVVLNFQGTPHLITFTRNTLFGVNPANGKTLWEMDFPDKYAENIATPVKINDLLLVSGPRTPIRGLRIHQQDGAWKVETAWQNDDVFLYMSSPVVSGERMFGMNARKKGQFICLDGTSGKVVWEGPGRMGRNATLVATKGKIVTMSTDGTLRIFKDSDAMEELASHELSDSAVWAHLMPAGPKTFFLRNKDKLSHWTF